MTPSPRILVTAGPTREPLDPVRYLSNRSSGRMGYAIAQAIGNAGAECHLVTGPTALLAPPVKELTKVDTALEMYEAVQKFLPLCQAAIFCAAVADYRPAVMFSQKIKKRAEELTLRLVRNPDILGSARQVFGFTGLLVGFAAETENLAQNALDKLHNKQCDLMVANLVSDEDIGFDSESNAVTIYALDGSVTTLTRRSKTSIARELVALILEKLPSSQP